MLAGLVRVAQGEVEKLENSDMDLRVSSLRGIMFYIVLQDNRIRRFEVHGDAAEVCTQREGRGRWHDEVNT